MSGCQRHASRCCPTEESTAPSQGASPSLPNCCKILETGLTSCDGRHAAHPEGGPDGPLWNCCKLGDDGIIICVAVTTVAPCARSAEPDDGSCKKWMKCAWAVELASGLHCAAEGAVSITFAVRDKQISLMLFGLDSVVEVGSVLLVMWRLSGARAAISKERLATGGIGMLLILLFCAAVAASTVHIVQHAQPESSLPGLIISSVSLFDMLVLSAAKLFLSKKLGSSCLAADAKCSLLCSLLSLCLLVGSIAFLVRPSVWWVDAAAALVLSVLIVKEGVDMVRNALSSNFVVGGCC